MSDEKKTQAWVCLKCGSRRSVAAFDPTDPKRGCIACIRRTGDDAGDVVAVVSGDKLTQDLALTLERAARALTTLPADRNTRPMPTVDTDAKCWVCGLDVKPGYVCRRHGTEGTFESLVRRIAAATPPTARHAADALIRAAPMALCLVVEQVVDAARFSTKMVLRVDPHALPDVKLALTVDDSMRGQPGDRLETAFLNQTAIPLADVLQCPGITEWKILSSSSSSSSHAAPHWLPAGRRGPFGGRP